MNPVEDYKQTNYSKRYYDERRKGMKFWFVIPLLIAIVWYKAFFVFAIITLCMFLYSYKTKEDKVVSDYRWARNKCLNFERKMCKDCTHKLDSCSSTGVVLERDYTFDD